MLEKLRNYLIAKGLIDGFKQIEKINWMSRALDVCYKRKELRDNWSVFLDSVTGILDDAKDETQTARKWGGR